MYAIPTSLKVEAAIVGFVVFVVLYGGTIGTIAALISMYGLALTINPLIVFSSVLALTGLFGSVYGWRHP